MSDDIPRDEWQASASRDKEEAQQADTLEAFLAATLASRGDNASSRIGAATPLHARTADERLASMLVAVGEEIAPSADFAAELQAQIVRRIHGRGHDGAGGSDGTGRLLRASLRRYRPLLAALAALLLLTLLVALPTTEAALRRQFCLGSVCIVFGGAPHPATGVKGSPTPTLLPSILDLAGHTTLAQARAQAGFPVRLPAYPADLGQPDAVFLQHQDGAAVVLVWVDHAHPSQVRLSLSEFASGIFVYKFATQPIATTTVHGQQALWTTGPYLVELQNGTSVTRQLVTGHALIWTEGTITYRLETSGSLDDAVRIAESLR